MSAGALASSSGGDGNNSSSSSDDSAGARGAVVLYSVTGQWCNYTYPPNFNYPNILTMTSSTHSQQLHDSLAVQGSANTFAALMLNSTSGEPIPLGPSNNNGTGSSSSSSQDNGPATPIAMIVLYVVTGVVSLFFMAIITMGALRAHRYPERYGPRRGHGRGGGGGQTRIGGLARATVHALPIVHFGEPEAQQAKRSPSREDGVEMAETARQPQDQEQGATAVGAIGSENNGTPTAAGVSAPNHGQPPAEPTANSTTPTSPVAPVSPRVAVPPINTSASQPPAAAAATNTPASPTTFSDLTCSICTDDFVAGEALRALPCGHRFHPACVDPWLVDFSGVCPNCRVDLRPTLEQLVAGSTVDLSTPVSSPTAINPAPAGFGGGPTAGRRGGGGGGGGSVNPSAELLELLGMDRAELAALGHRPLEPDQRRELLRRVARRRRERAEGGGARSRMSQRLSRLIRRSHVGEEGFREGDEEDMPPVPPVATPGGEGSGRARREERGGIARDASA